MSSFPKTAKEYCKFEQIYGAPIFLKLCTSALNKLLVDKGLITKEELINYTEEEFKNFLTTIKK